MILTMDLHTTHQLNRLEDAAAAIARINYQARFNPDVEACDALDAFESAFDAVATFATAEQTAPLYDAYQAMTDGIAAADTVGEMCTVRDDFIINCARIIGLTV